MGLLFNAASFQSVKLQSTSLASANTNGLTLMGWVKPVSLNLYSYNCVIYISTGTDVLSTRASLYVANSGAIYANGRCLDAEGSGSTATGTSGLVTTGSWQHLAAVYDFSNKILKLYRNGVLDYTSGTLGWSNGPTSNTAALASGIGAAYNGTDRWFDGTIEDCRIYNRILNLEELQTIYSCKGYDNNFYGLQHRFIMLEKSDLLVA